MSILNIQFKRRALSVISARRLSVALSKSTKINLLKSNTHNQIYRLNATYHKSKPYKLRPSAAAFSASIWSALLGLVSTTERTEPFGLMTHLASLKSTLSVMTFEPS